MTFSKDLRERALHHYDFSIESQGEWNSTPSSEQAAAYAADKWMCQFQR